MTTIELEFLPPMSTIKATSFSPYYLRRAFKSFKVILVPYFPAKGEVFTLIETPIKGASILRQGITLAGYPY